MVSSSKIAFKDLKSCIANAIKESSYVTDARLYNIANQVHYIKTAQVETVSENIHGLSKIIDKTIKDSVGLGCDLSVIVKGILLGAFRSTPFILADANKTISIVITEILQAVFKNKGDAKEAIEGVLAAVVIIANDYNLDEQEAFIIAKENILSTAKGIDPKFADDIKKVYPKLDDLL